MSDDIFEVQSAFIAAVISHYNRWCTIILAPLVQSAFISAVISHSSTLQIFGRNGAVCLHCGSDLPLLPETFSFGLRCSLPSFRQ